MRPFFISVRMQTLPAFFSFNRIFLVVPQFTPIHSFPLCRTVRVFTMNRPEAQSFPLPQEESILDDKVLINALVELAGLEEELLAARGLQARNLARQGSLGELQEEMGQDADRAESTGLATEVRFRNQEGEIRQLESNLEDRRKRLAGLGEPRQIEALQKEIDLLSERLDELETQALEMLDEARDNNLEAETARQECTEQDERRRRQQGTMRDESVQAAAAEVELTAEIERLVGMLPTAVSRHVNRLRQGLDQSVVYVSSGACGGCCGQLPAQQGLAADRGTSLVQCPSCARYVVHRPWS